MEHHKTLTVNINYLREKRCLCNKVKAIALNASGILFGGVVRDDIIGKHYRSLFIKNSRDFDKYWDASYDSDTKFRLVTPNDVDVFFRAENNFVTFQHRLRSFVTGFNGTIDITQDANFRQFEYAGSNRYLKHSIVNINFRIGKTFFERGMSLHLKIDVIHINHAIAASVENSYEFTQLVSRTEPPFNQLDFLSNVFIMEKSSSGDYVTRLSNSTGTPIDDMPFSRKASFSAKIIDDIINFRTEFALKLDWNHSEVVSCYRILKMINRAQPWTITNLPFRFIAAGELKEKLDDSCCICLQEMGDSADSELVELNTHKLPKSNYLHRGCFIEYLMKEQRQRFMNVDENRVECRCPFRGFFNFRSCHLKIDFE